MNRIACAATVPLCFLSLLVMLTGLPALSLAAGGTVEWTYNPSVAGKHEARAMAVDSNGAVILAGYVSALSKDLYTIKVLADGSGLAWQAKTLDFNGSEDQLTAVAVDGNDDIIVTGYVHNGSNFDIHTIKYGGADGAILWQHTFNGIGGGDDFAGAIAVDTLNNVYVGGTMRDASAKEDFVIIKYVPAGPNPDGTPTWSAGYNGSDNGHDRLAAIAVNIHGIAVTGESQNAALDFDFVVVKFNLDGEQEWEKRTSDPGNGKGLDVALDAAGNVVATGYLDNGSDRDHYTVKYPAVDGPAVWAKTRDRSYDDEGRALWLDSSGNVYVAGSSFTLTTGKDLTVTRYAAADGDDTAPAGWHVDHNTVNGNSDVGVDIVGDNAGDVFVTSITNDNVGGFDDIHTYKFCKEHGTLLWTATHGVLSKHDRPVGLGLAADGHPVMAGWSDTIANSYDFIAVKYNAGALDAPSALTATTVSTTEISLAWSDNSENEEYFVIERRNGANDWVVVTSNLPAGTIAYNDAGLTADHRYYYRVKAVNATDGSSAWSNEANARTTLVSYVAPLWQHVFAGSAGGDDEPAAIAVGPDNHPVVTGFSFSLAGGYDYFTLKLDHADAAVERWSARYNDDDNESDFATAVAIDSSNRVVVSGYSSLYGGGTSNTNDVYTLGYPAEGATPTWDHQYNGPSGNDDRSAAVATAVDGSDNAVVVGYGKNARPDNDIYVIKYSPDGTPQKPLWAATPFDGGGVDQPAAVAYDPNGDIFVVGKSWKSGNFDYFVAKYNGGDGTMAWGGVPRFYNGGGNSTDYATDLAVTAAGDVYVTGYSVGSGGTGDIVTLKYDGATGNIMPGWPKIFDGGGYDVGVAVGVDPINNEVVVAGTTYIGPGNHDAMVVRYTPAGNEVWSKYLDFTGSDEATAAMAIDRTGVACVTAATDNGGGDNIVAVMFDHLGLIVGANVLDGVAGGMDYPVDVAFNAYGEAFIAGVTTNAANNTDFMVFKTTSTVEQAPAPLTATLLYTEAQLSWTDNNRDETGFRVERKTGTCSETSNWTWLEETAANTTSYLASGLNEGQPYCFRVQSFNVLGESSRWVEVDVVTVEADPPDNLTATPFSTTEVLIEWEDRTTGESSFNLQRCTGADCDFSTHTSYPQPAETLNYLDNEVCEGVVYRYRLNAEKSGHWVTSYTSTPNVPMPVKQAPTTLSNDWVSEAWVELKWTDNSPDETAFIVERCSGTGCSNFGDPVTLISPAGNVLHLRMDEALWNSTPNEVVDLSPTASHGRAYGATATPDSGKYAGAGTFNGSSAYVATPLVLDQSAATSPGATFAAWVYPASTSANNHFVIGTDNGGNDWSLLRNAGFWYVANGTDAALVNTGVAVTPNVWQHLALVFNPASGLALYRNGVSVWNNAAIAFDDSSAPVHVGRRGSLNQEFFDGRLDEISVFKRPLNVSEVGVLYSHGLGRYNDRTVAHSTSYSYRIMASKSAPCGWTSDSSNTHSATTTPPEPDGLLATASHANRVNLFWADNTTTETKFTVERCTTAGCVDFSPLAVAVGADAVSLNDDTVCPGISYRYRLKAEKEGAGGWVSGYSNEAAVVTPTLVAPALALGVVSEEQVDLQWSFNTADLTGYKVSRCQGDATFCSDDGNYTLLETKSVLPAGAKLMLPMDELQWRGTPDEVSDISGNVNHGQAFGGATTVAGGKSQRGGTFDGVDDYVITQLNIDQGTSATGVTFEAWVYPTTTSGNQYIVSTDNGGNDWGFATMGSSWGVMNGSSTALPSPAIPVTINTWQHIVVTFQPGVGVTLYKNGNQNIASSTTISTDSSDANVTLGRQGSNNSGYFVGRIDNAVVYDRVLTPVEVLARYQSYSFSQSGLPSDTEFHYRVWPYKTADCSTDGAYATVMAKTLKPPAPINLILTKVDTTRIDVGWTDLATSETGYRLQWCEGTGCVFPLDPTVNAVTLGVDAQKHVDTNVCEGQTYSYRVRAEKDWVSEADYTWVSDWTTGSVTALAKSATDGFTAAVVSESEITLGWADNNADEDRYVLQRCVNNDAPSCAVDNDAAFVDLKFSMRPTLWLKMDEDSWGTVLNSAVGGTNATKYGDAVPVNDVGRGRVGQFDGNGDYLRVNHYAGINPTRAITVSTWAKSSGANWDSDHSLLSKRDAFILSPVLGTGRMRFYIYRAGDTWQVVDVNPGVDITQWHQYTGVYDGTNIILYVDGVARGSVAYPGTINADTGPLDIGRDDSQTAANRNLGGWLDDALIFDQALTPAMVLALYNGQLNLGVNILDAGLTPSTEYFYRLRAQKEATCPWPVEWDLKSATTVTPPTPTSLVLSPVNTTQIDVAWVDNSGAETGYRVQRCEGAGCSFPAIPTGADSVLLPPDTLAYSDLAVKEGQSYSYRVRAEKSSAPGWETAWLGPKTIISLAKTAPLRLTATRLSEASVALAWEDSNDDETGFRIERCAGVGCVDFAEIDDIGGNGAEPTNLVASGTLATGNFSPYAYNVTHPTTGLTVRTLRLYNSGTPQVSNSAALALNTDTDYIVTFEAWCDAGPDINLQNDLLPDTLPEFAHTVSTVPKTFRAVFNSSHPDMLGSTMMRFFHYNPGRYIYVTNIKLRPPSRVTYTDSDSGLLPDTNYRYQVKTYKTATNDWQAGPSNIATVLTEAQAPSVLLATAINTTEVGLSWTDNADTETSTEIWRSPAGCGSFAKIDEVGPMVTTFNDDDVATDTDYCYRVVAKNEGLSRYGGGDWSHSAPVIISPFVADAYYQLIIPYNSNMRSDFGDLRFYDETAQRQLSYSIRNYVDGTSATVWIKTRQHNAITMYYGNPSVSAVDNDGDFRDYYDFPGTVIDTGRWIEVDNASYNAIAQNDGLVLRTTTDYNWNKALISQKTYDRQFQWELYADLTIDGDTNGASGDWFIFGWLLNQATFTSYNQFVHGLFWNNYQLGSYEKASYAATGQNYSANKNYEIKVAMTSSGAKYSIRGGAFAGWTLLATRDLNTDQFMRIAIGQRSHNATIHSVTVLPVPRPATLGSESVNARTSFGYPWVSPASNVATVKTPAPVAPGNLQATAISDSAISLSWTDETDAETRFYIERCQVISGTECTNFAPYADVAGGVTGYLDEGLPVSTAYTYQLRAYKDAKHTWFSPYSAPATGKTFPQPATGLSAVPVSSRMIRLTWEDHALDEDGYEIEVMTWNGRFIRTGRVGADMTTYIDTVGIEPDQLYTYRVRPYRGEDKSPYSEEASATPRLSDGEGTCVP